MIEIFKGFVNATLTLIIVLAIPLVIIYFILDKLGILDKWFGRGNI